MSFFLRPSQQLDKINIDDYTSLPNIGNSNIIIGQGSNTVELPIIGDISLSNIGISELISISNTGTITSTANLLFNNNQRILFYDGNNYIFFNESNLDINSYSNINLNPNNGNVYINGVIFSSTGGTNLPVLGDANIYIGNGIETSQVSISGDITLSNTGVTELISISNTGTITSTANINFNVNKGILFGDNNKYLRYDGTDLNISLNSSNIKLGKHTIVSNTFTLLQSNIWSNLSGVQNITFDFNQGSDFYLTLASGANLTINSPTNVNRIGQQGSIIIKNPSSGNTHEINWQSGGSWYFPAGLAPQLTITNNTIDIFSYLVVESNIIVVNDATNFQQF
jgi:hypothetical protein